MNEEIDEYDIYHQDFTTASDWEIFIARIEEVINEWQLTKTKLSKNKDVNYSKKWMSKSEDISFQGMTFSLSYHALEPSLDTTLAQEKLEIKEKKKYNQVLNGIRDSTKHFMDDSDDGPFPVSSWFGVKQYLMLCPGAPLLEESQIKLIMSSINIAFANVDCGVPFFVKIRQHWQHCFLGMYEDSQFHTNFDTIHLKRIPNQCSHLSGLANLFKGKIASPVSLEPLQMSTKFSYELKDLDAFAWKRPQTNEFLSIDGFDVKKLIELPFGAGSNPLQSASLNVIWPRFLENTLIDSSTYSDFDPMTAPTWTISIKMKDNINCQLSDLVYKLLDLMDVNNLLMDTLGLSRSLGIVNPLHKITEAPITISKLVKAAMGSGLVSEFKGPISDELLMPILYYIFPDAVEDSGALNYPQRLEVENKQGLCGGVKGSPAGGLVQRVSTAAARLLEAGGLPYLAHFWYELAQELQYRWEHLILVPGVAEGGPNARSCLLHQKLQLLNCCVVRAREHAAAANSSDDEFFDCSDGEEEHQPTDKPAGRHSRLEDATLKNGAPLYIPQTQDPAPKTEDQVEEDAELMERLGEDARASELRARMMSASLLSDMEAFKAANPGAELCDFVRWYSPRDWKPDDGGSLGDRMLLPGNTWLETWSLARPVPANKQRRLFDETKEAERVLHFLRSRTVGGVAELLLPGLLQAGAMRAAEEGCAGSGASGGGGSEARRAAEAAARELREAEGAWSGNVAARRVLCGARPDAALDAAGRARLLRTAGGALPPPARREFTLRLVDAHAPQLMRAALAADLTIVAAFTEPTVLH